MIVTARAAIGTIALALAFGPAGVAAENSIRRNPETIRSTGTAVSMEGCDALAPQDQDARPRARRGVLGWLYKYTRNVDIERASTPHLPGFLRSPLLAALPGRSDVDCDHADASDLDGVVKCAVISLNAGSDESVIFTAPLPQLGEATLGGIEDEIRERISRGEKITLETSKGDLVRIRQDEARYISARACRTDA